MAAATSAVSSLAPLAFSLERFGWIGVPLHTFVFGQARQSMMLNPFQVGKVVEVQSA